VHSFEFAEKTRRFRPIRRLVSHRSTSQVRRFFVAVRGKFNLPSGHETFKAAFQGVSVNAHTGGNAGPRPGTGRLPVAFLEELRGRLTLSGVVGRRVKLERAGREFKACCPFHNEKTPSFYVNDDKNFFHCFGCGAHGDVIGFRMRSDGVDFIEAVRDLAGEAGLQMPSVDAADPAADAARNGVLACLEAAAVHFAAALAGSPGEAYVREERSLSPGEIAQWRIGFAGGDVAIAALRRAGFTNDVLLGAGLLAQRDDRTLYPFFRNRLTIPICDARGRVRGFGARALDDTQPKYLNSPASEIFDKGRLLFGADHARQRKRDARGGVGAPAPLVVGEGYFDAIALCGMGFRGVATNGTAMTEAHIAELWRLEAEPVVAFDGDAAGAKAMARAVERALPLLRADRTLRFARLPAGDDPDSARRNGRAGAIADCIGSATPFSTALFEICSAGIDMRVPEGRARCEALLRNRIDRIADPALKSAFESSLIYQGVRRFRVVDGGRRGTPSGQSWAAPPARLPDPEATGRRVRERLADAVLACVLRGGSVVDDLVEELAALEPDIPGIGEAMSHPAGFAAGERGRRLLADRDLAREFAFLAPNCGARTIERGLRYALMLFAANRLAGEIVRDVPASQDAPGWDAYLAKTRELAEMRERLALGIEDDES